MKREISLLRVLSMRDCVNRLQVLVRADLGTIRWIMTMSIYNGDSERLTP